MIHYSCDLCKRDLDPEKDVRYVVHMEIHAALEPNVEEDDDDRDYLAELHDMLETMDDSTGACDAQDENRQMRFDLCCDCRKKFLKNPLGREAWSFDYSKN